MPRLQFWILNALGAVFLALIVIQFGIVWKNTKLNDELVRQQTIIANASQLEPVLDSLGKRIARGSDVDPRLKTLMLKYGMRVTLEVNGKTKNYP